MTGRMPERSSLHHYLNVLRRRRWIVVQAVVLTTLATFFFSLRQERLYQATAEVLLMNRSLDDSADRGILAQSPERIAQTAADVARVPRVAARALAAVGVKDRTPGELLRRSSVTPRANSNLLEFNVIDHFPELAVRLASAYAREFTIYDRLIATQALVRARRDVEAKIRQLERSGESNTDLYRTLLEKAEELRTAETLQTANVVVRPADAAAKIQPRPVRNAILGFSLGVLLGLGLAFLREALDTRVRSAEEIGDRLGLPLLARLPQPPTKLRNENKLSMLVEPDGVHAEAFRVLRTNLEFANLERGAQIIMVTSALEAEGKSTTVANLAVALARGGRRVVAVDLDLRRPYLDRLFALTRRPGLTQVALGLVDLEDVLVPIPVGDPAATDEPADDRYLLAGASNGRRQTQGILQVLPTGPVPPDVGEFVGSRTLKEILEQLRAWADVVLVDSPPLLRVGDAITLSGNVDAMIVAANLASTRRHLLSELKRVLDNCPPTKLGFVLTGANLEDGYGYGYYGYGGYYYAPREQAKRERVA